jgi:hypothetical protein
MSNHALNAIHVQGRWYLLDPTIYNTTFHNPEIPSGVEARAWDERIAHLVVPLASLPYVSFDQTADNNYGVVIPESISEV